MGYKVEILPPPDDESVRLGLKYTNNDICYPAIITIGDVLKALASGRYDPDDIAVAFTETGGPCRATNYISLIKKAVLAAGFDNIPVISASFQKISSNFQPGFILNRPKLTSLILSSLLVVDQIIRMYYATAVRETRSGESLQVLQRHLAKARESIGCWTMKNRNKILAAAIADFNGVPTRQGIYPKAGLVGEIYVKYNPFGNNNIVDKLMKNGIEVVIPPLFTFFIQTFVNVEFNHFNNIERSSSLQRKKLSVIHALVNRKIRQANRMMSQFRHGLEPVILPELLAEKAKKVINLANQAGEGWLLPGEIVAMAESGIRNIISLQPFGCIANHVVAKGIGARISSLFPDLSLLNLDMDAGNSDVNMQNRLDFFIHSAKSRDGQEPAFS